MILKTELEDRTLKEGFKLNGLVWDFLFIQEVENPRVFLFFPTKENSSRVGFKEHIAHGDLCPPRAASLDLKENRTWHPSQMAAEKILVLVPALQFFLLLELFFLFLNYLAPQSLPPAPFTLLC